jgi:spore maturation protein CgeB
MHWSSLQDLAARVFEIMGMGLCPVINRVPDLTPIFEENVHYLGFSSLEEAIDKFEMAAKDGELRRRMGRMASDQVHLVSTWDVRIAQLLQVCGYD